MEGDPQALLEVPGHRFPALVLVGAACQDHLAGGVAAQHVFDRLHDVLVAQARRRLDSAPGQRSHGVDQVALGSFASRPEIRCPALEEALPAGGDQDDLRQCPGEARHHPGGPWLDVIEDEFGQCRLVQRAAENDQNATPQIHSAGGHDRV